VGIDKDDIDVLLSLASLCTRLHSIALPIYFARLEFDGSSLRLGFSKLMIKDHVSRILKGIRLSFPPFIQDLTSLTCHLYSFSRADFNGVLNLLDYVHAVSDINLRFGHGKSGSLAPELFSVLAAFGKKRCKSLNIVDLPQGHKQLRALEFQPWNTLESISIWVDDLSPEVLHWIVLSINSSPLRALELSIENQQDIQTLLSQSTAPYLKELWVIPQVPINEIMTFLSRHPGITKLHISADGDLPRKLDTYALRHLSSLSAAPAVVALLLSQPGRAPNLTYIHLFTDSSYTATQSWEMVYRDDDEMELIQVFALLQSYPRITFLSLTLFKRLGSKEWIRDLEKAAIDGLRQIRMLKVYTESRLVHLLPNFIRSLHDLIPLLFPHLGTLVVDVPATIVVEKLPIVRQLCAVCPTLSKISFSRAVDPTSVAPYL
jgi:hypothetical protein